MITINKINQLIELYGKNGILITGSTRESKNNGIEFNSQVKVQSSSLPISPKDIAHLIENLLDYALKVAKMNLSV